ncbi:hypothetical protein WN51_12355 [Melipona quadrifasciata]|uniref:Uncharacterized protein n=1 Tax=Melipona quadrifasciata TaxID=166423 RepID=A0A0M9A2G4_9HYME|nr:hypothetical protein WN51_12355 [Melipona quadrifasciata]
MARKNHTTSHFEGKITKIVVIALRKLLNENDGCFLISHSGISRIITSLAVDLSRVIDLERVNSRENSRDRNDEQVWREKEVKNPGEKLED